MDLVRDLRNRRDRIKRTGSEIEVEASDSNGDLPVTQTLEYADEFGTEELCFVDRDSQRASDRSGNLSDSTDDDGLVSIATVGGDERPMKPACNCWHYRAWSISGRLAESKPLEERLRLPAEHRTGKQFESAHDRTDP